MSQAITIYKGISSANERKEFTFTIFILHKFIYLFNDELYL